MTGTRLEAVAVPSPTETCIVLPQGSTIDEGSGFHMTNPLVVSLRSERDALAPDGSEVRLLAQSSAASMAHFTLHAGQTSAAVVHRTVDELWWVQSDSGEIWLCNDSTSIAIPVGTRFQFRALGETLRIVGTTIPPWPGPNEAELVAGKWSDRIRDSVTKQ
jgi:mannose-6-phosphate isomerase-like protein (cupin superfamily)